MKIFLALLPIGILALGFFIFRFNGRKELLRMDLIQFIYAFVLAPMMLIWLKTIVFYSLDADIGVYGQEDKFVIDTVLTTILFLIYAFLVIHSLTKSFQIRKAKDPLFDIFEHAEYFHFWLSHIVVYSGGLLVMLILGGLNIFSPLLLLSSKTNLYFGIILGVIFSILYYTALRLYKTKEQKKFDKVMKLQLYAYTFLMLGAYIMFRPKFTPQYSVFWCTSFFFFFTSVLSQLVDKNRGILK